MQNGKINRQKAKSNKTYLAIDIGNTTISMAVMRGQSIVETIDVATHLTLQKLKNELANVFKKIGKKYENLSNVIICSVVPSVNSVVEKLAQLQFNTKVILLGRDYVVPIKNLYRNPKLVGQDRLVGAFAAQSFYGNPVVVIDLGTAITFDVVNSAGHYEGGMIIPGIQLSADALFQKTALLPRIERFSPPKQLIGKDTIESILSGIFYGYGAMCSGMIQNIAEKLRSKPAVVLTGGYATTMKKFIKVKVDIIEPNLIFKGLGLCLAKYQNEC